MKKQIQIQRRPVSVIAREIVQDWRNVHYTAKPYLHAMLSLSEVPDNYGADSAKSIILHFLVNASSWRGEKAREIKKRTQSHGQITSMDV